MKKKCLFLTLGLGFLLFRNRQQHRRQMPDILIQRTPPTTRAQVFVPILINCPSPSGYRDRVSSHNSTSDLDHVLDAIHRAPVLTEPFKFYAMVCNVWPPDLYELMLKYLPPVQRIQFPGETRFSPPCGSDVAHPSGSGYLHIHHLLGRPSRNKHLVSTADIFKVWHLDVKNKNAALATWERVDKVLRAPKLKELLWKKLQVLEPGGDHIDTRLMHSLPSNEGSNAKVHTDSPNTVATMLFQTPTNLDEDEVNTFGTCFHDSNGTCTHKLRFLPNTAVAMRTVPSKVQDARSMSHKKDIFGAKLTGGIPSTEYYRGREVSFPSWHSAPVMKFTETCTLRWRRILFLTFVCRGQCFSRWKISQGSQKKPQI